MVVIPLKLTDDDAHALVEYLAPIYDGALADRRELDKSDEFYGEDYMACSYTMQLILKVIHQIERQLVGPSGSARRVLHDA